MLILALDTSSAGGSGALVRDGRVVVERGGDASRTHGERLPRELMTLFADAGASLHDVDRFAVSTGPGSFTGLRVGIATIQGLALARGALVAAVSAFEALAATVDARRPTPDAQAARSATAVWIDAHRGEVFASLFAGDGTPLAAPTALTPDATLAAWSAALAPFERVSFAGNGAVRYRDAILRSLGARAIVATEIPLLAGTIGGIAARDATRAVRPHAIVPLYVRRSDAELARDRRQAREA